MSYELANEKWIDGDRKGLLGQFASTKGYGDLIEAANGKDYPVLFQFFTDGVTAEVEQARAELMRLAAVSRKDVASTARAMRKLADGQEIIIVTNGAN